MTVFSSFLLFLKRRLQVPAGLIEGGIEGESRAKMGDRLVKHALLREDDAEAVPHSGARGIRGYGIPEMNNRAVGISGTGKEHAKEAVGLRMGRLDAQGFFELAGGLFRLSPV